jgi:hypothetical protein
MQKRSRLFLKKTTIMATVIINHKVTDYEKWKAGFDADLERRETMGATQLAAGHKAGDPSNVWVVMDVADVSSLGAELSKPEFQKILEEIGVLRTDVTVLQ